MTPRGEIHFPTDSFLPDFSDPTVTPADRVWFIHEMGHVWQFQLGYGVTWAGVQLGLTGGYSDDVARGKPQGNRTFTS